MTFDLSIRGISTIRSLDLRGAVMTVLSAAGGYGVGQSAMAGAEVLINQSLIDHYMERKNPFDGRERYLADGRIPL